MAVAETLEEDRWRLASEVLLLLQLEDCWLVLRDSLLDPELLLLLVYPRKADLTAILEKV